MGWVEIPLYEACGAATGQTVRVPSPPPAVVRRDAGHAGPAVFQLRRVAECVRFGCGCIREETLRYVRVD